MNGWLTPEEVQDNLLKKTEGEQLFWVYLESGH